MAEPIDHLAVVYCDSWDANSRAVVAPRDAERARARDESGEQYVVLLLAGGNPWALLEISWGDYACTVWRLDAQFRRDAKRDMRLLTDGDLFLTEQIAWRYRDLQRPEFDPAVACRPASPPRRWRRRRCAAGRRE